MNGQHTDGLVGSVVGGRYEVHSLLGTGGMATVYLATDTTLRRRVALKVLHPHLSRDRNFAERFEREAIAAAQLSHPHVVSMLDRGEDLGVLYLVMEYVPGHTLRDLLDEQGSLAPKQALALLDAVVDGLAAAHAAGIIHRDVKPANVLLADDGRVKVGDFGLARSLSATSITDSLFGTAEYISPEMLMGRPVDARTDLYATGIMLFEMLTGRLPFTGEDRSHVAFQHVNDDVPPPSAVAPGLAPELDELVGWMTRKDPDGRPPSALALLGEVRDIRRSLTDAQLDYRAPGGAGKGLIDDDAGTSVLDHHDLLTERLSGERTEALPRGTEVITAVASGHTAVMPRPVTPDAPAPLSAREQRRQAKEADRAAKAAAARPTHQLGRGNPRRRGAIWVAIVVVLAVLAAAIGWFFGFGPGALATVPPVKNLTVAQAQALIQQAGLGFTTHDVFDDGISAGLIVASAPGAGTQVRKFEGVQLMVSKGPELFPLADLTAKTLDAAKASLADAKLTLGTASEAYSDTVPAGAVMAQDPAAGTPLKHGSPVALTVSKGRQPIPVPKIVGMKQADAVAALTAAGLKPVVADAPVFDRNVPAGSVSAQSPAAGQNLVKGDTVTITLSKGPRMVHVPDVFGKTEQDAIQILQAAGFAVKSNYTYGRPVFGLVAGQDKTGDQPEGTTITLTVA
ncbi:Stk1 family PASTA domain-containing Ser/Thr kinase [Sinomonas sp. ASV322]|uniref:Stk1 family PASTA domain-containing Ser/Thr kinase n=1 Tax=Sinomonas sp. ASV322 TaxID=3041920 RepID=UPI0027DC3ADC|nr:Stk1 family PASTA domain-containing Ser/Thr kinase [Sinomonas sp. ASV322]MDQ4500790.1 Stk1 family PASTA domain-containing Ser/Thr kinase [Sinomonas sp. ASV322]